MHSEKIFGKDGARFLACLQPLISELIASRTRYAYMKPEVFKELALRDTSQAMATYWSEMLGRAHLAAVTSIIRTYRWAQGMASSHKAGLYLPYCASFRGLLESVADTHDSLQSVALTLAKNHDTISLALAGQSSVAMISSELEDTLIHYAYARKIEKGFTAPATHIAKTAADYLKTIAAFAPFDVKALYAELCQLAHPAAQTVHYMLDVLSADESVLNASRESELIEHFASMHATAFPWTLMYGFNSSILVLKVLNHFDNKNYHVAVVNRMEPDGMPAWTKIESILSK